MLCSARGPAVSQEMSGHDLGDEDEAADEEDGYVDEVEDDDMDDSNETYDNESDCEDVFYVDDDDAIIYRRTLIKL